MATKLTPETVGAWWNENRWRITASNLKECLQNLGYAASPEEMESRKEVVELCQQITEKTK